MSRNNARPAWRRKLKFGRVAGRRELPATAFSATVDEVAEGQAARRRHTQHPAADQKASDHAIARRDLQLFGARTCYGKPSKPRPEPKLPLGRLKAS